MVEHHEVLQHPIKKQLRQPIRQPIRQPTHQVTPQVTQIQQAVQAVRQEHEVIVVTIINKQPQHQRHQPRQHQHK